MYVAKHSVRSDSFVRLDVNGASSLALSLHSNPAFLRQAIARRPFLVVTSILSAAVMSAGCATRYVAPGARASAISPSPTTSVADTAHVPRSSSADGALPVFERVIEIGRSREQRPIDLYQFGSGDRPIFILGGIHGSEGNSAVCASLLVSYLHSHPREAGNVSLAIVPEANPDGLIRKVRFNARRVDLNRNFPAANWKKTFASGGVPASEPETQALVQIIREMRPRRILSIHSIVGEPCNNYDGPAEPLARMMAQHNGYIVKGWIGYPTPGSLGSWAGDDLGVPVVTLELPASLPGDESWQHNRSAILQFITAP